jgi:hypothetical protein
MRRVLIGFAVLGLAAIAAAPARARSDARHATGHATGLSFRKALCVRNRRCHRHHRPRSTAGQLSPAATTPLTPKDTTPPKFGGLQQAFACTPGPQRPGQTTPFNLSWEAATDDFTPPSQIVYDVYLATTSGGEDFSDPTWVTPAGVIAYRTAGLPSHGTFYFVVRARDMAGNEDANTVELRGIDPCL